MSERVDAVIGGLLSGPAPYYSYERNGLTEGAFRRAGAVETVVAVAGYRLRVLHLAGVLVSIRPRAASAGRGHVVLAPWGEDYPGCRMTPICGRLYGTDPCGPARLAEALAITALAWETAEGDLDAFYSALGARGQCACCGAALTDPLSMARGIGPECIKKVHPRAMIQHVQRRDIQAGTRDQVSLCL